MKRHLTVRGLTVSLAVLLALCLLTASTFATTVKTVNRIVFADQFCSTQGVQDQSCVINAINSLPASGGQVVLPYGVTNISSTIVVHKHNVLLIGRNAGTRRCQLYGACHGIHSGTTLMNSSVKLPARSVQDRNGQENYTIGVHDGDSVRQRLLVCH
jgi:hypothetical protein